jgi:hypothetical protein
MSGVIAGAPASQWIVERVIVLDWYDGPREGLLILSKPDAAFYFRAAAELAEPRASGEALHALTAIDRGELDAIVARLGTPEQGKTWVVDAPSGGDDELARLLTAVKRRAPLPYWIRSTDLTSFSEVWRVLADG